VTLLPEPLPESLVAALTRLAARPQLLLALDFDGVLAPFVLDPLDARPLPAAGDALHALAATPGTRIALVSGRPLDQLVALADPPPTAVLVGSHGAQSRPVIGGIGGATGGEHGGDLDAAAVRLLADVTAELHRIAARHPGATVEQKPAGAVLHTRGATRPVAEAAGKDALAGPAGWPGVHLTVGKEVVELAVSDATKGGALAALRAHFGLPAGAVLYVGDDETDERAFAVLDDDAGDVTVKVGAGDTLARHRVADPQAVARLLRTLVALRS